eukprot:c18429_g1_i1.p1 GENE.c18429_g1_i1~~c18429_g1_i1.p1  ORF type:complete len:141 (-),score=16.40 c18429_g1_i1:231-653(-)
MQPHSPPTTTVELLMKPDNQKKALEWVEGKNEVEAKLASLGLSLGDCTFRVASFNVTRVSCEGNCHLDVVVDCGESGKAFSISTFSFSPSAGLSDKEIRDIITAQLRTCVLQSQLVLGSPGFEYHIPNCEEKVSPKNHLT